MKSRIGLLFLAVWSTSFAVMDSQKKALAADAAEAKPSPGPRSNESAESRKLPTTHLPNAIQVHPNVISGGQPDGEAGFRELQSLGVKTVISVDGAKPDAKAARKFGLRYIHLPHGYDGIPDERVRELAKAVRELEGPIYVHCHHGKHRSPAAASVACVAGGLIQCAQAIPVLRLAGTSESYRGLYQTAESVRPLDEKLLTELKVEFRESVPLPPLAVAMVEIEHVHDHLKELESAGWKVPPKHPDIHPPHEALLLREHFTELLRSPGIKGHPEAFEKMVRESEADAMGLETELDRWSKSGMKDAAPARLGDSLARITNNCKRCHQQFRDPPLSEKKNAARPTPLRR